MQEKMKKDEENEQKAYEKLHEQRVANVKKCIKMLSERKYNTNVTQSLLKETWKRLENCKGYDEYDSLKSELQSEENRISDLPKEIPKPEVPENDLDNPPEAVPEEEFPT